MNVIIRRLFVVSGVLCLLAAFGMVGYNVADARRAESEALSVLDSLIPAIEEKGQNKHDIPNYDRYEEDPPETDRINGNEGSNGSISPDDTSAPVTPSDVADYVAYPDMDMPSIVIEGQKYLGYIEIPELKLKLPVAGGVFDINTLKYSPAIFSGSAYRGDMVIAAHNYTAHFAPLYYAKEGTKVIFTDADGNVFRYRVSLTENVYPSEHDRMVSGDSWDLTLFTCTMSGEQRFTVRCVAEK